MSIFNINCKTYNFPLCYFCRHYKSTDRCDILFHYNEFGKTSDILLINNKFEIAADVLNDYYSKHNILKNLIIYRKYSTTRISDFIIYYSKAAQLYYPDLADKINTILLLL